jgi:DNA gyrase subunit A
VTTNGGVTIRVPVGSIRTQGRNTMGVRIIRLEEGDAVKDAVALEPPPEEEGDGPSGETPRPPPSKDATPAGPEADPEEGDAEEGDDAPPTPTR